MTHTMWRRLPRTSPEAAGVDRAAIAKLTEQLDLLGTHSLLVLRHGAVVAERFWAPHTAERPHQMFSVSKTFTAMAVGLAVSEGLLTVEDRVVDLLPEAAPAEVSDKLAAMRVEHLLTMTSGHAGDLFETFDGLGDDWPRALLAAEVVREPGSRFLYDTAATYLLSAIITRLTGQRLLDYLTPRVLAPLGITDATWEQDPRGIDMGGFGLSVTTEDMAAFGQLLLQRGRWGDAQLIPASWVETAAANHVDSSVQGWGVDASIGYGYQMWRCQPGCARADGAFGQFIVVWPEHDAVVAITSGSQRTQDQLDAVWGCLGSAFGTGQALPAPDDADARADDAEPDADRIDRADDGADSQPLQLELPQGVAWTAAADLVDGRTFALDTEVPVPEAPPGTPPFRTVTVRRDDDGIVVDVGPLRGHARYGAWGTTTDGGVVPTTSSAYAWTDDRTLEVRVAGLGMPFVWTIRLVVAADGASIDVAVDQNVSFGARELVRATARRVRATAR
ncbi:beta-lactamase [Xylanimonas cellulosilytica DSM 15894]|uniref:Beta-lactamase n=1 Tax=Xylanimonas cellulosilytica (strain DSM 15894 / JCM 12276 / CECT 5975 / KCTC 9989 / LMG 20990 / NBRC 107835 / XIL07) TaxID=446471 RepID=D1BUQ3_XYLCX|nr:serine hydrolase [Xylanimonas cellulosilytica]ACZ29294.1 beta-lactamase [Xylanimonas cellulosilytica DSM 15894]